MFLKHMPKKKILLFSGDLFLVSGCYAIAPLIRFSQPVYNGFEHLGSALLIMATFLMMYFLLDLYDISMSFRKPRYVARFLAANAIAVSLVAAVLFLLPGIEHRRGIFLISAAMVGVSTYAWRLVFRAMFRPLLTIKKNVVLIGHGRGAEKALKVIDGTPEFALLQFIELDAEQTPCCDEGTRPAACKLLVELQKTHKVDLLVTAVKRVTCVTLLREILRCKMRGIGVTNMPSLYETHLGKLPVLHLDDYWFVGSRMLGVTPGIYNLKIKRLLDILLALLGLLASLPLTLLTAIAIKLDSKGPLFYRQARVGLNEKIFEVIKFRSMRTDAEAGGAVWASQGDNRVTRVGKFIRKTRIDEIPQLWNVLKGEMSLIGPRPERPEFVSILDEKIPYYFLRHSVKPGVTGWAQVMYPYGASERDALKKLQYDLFYIKNLYLSLEFHILLKTVRVVLFGVGAR